MSTRRTRRRNLGRKGLALLLVLLAGFYFSRGLFQRLQKTYPPNAFYQVKRADMLISITEDGALRALNETVVRSGLEGYNRVLHLVPEGSYVQKGDLLAELDSSGLKDRLNEQELIYQDRLFQLLQAKGNLNIQKSLAESQIKDAELKVENAQDDFEKYRDAGAPLLIKTVEARTAVLADQVRIASERYARTQELLKSGNATRSEVEADALILKREQLGLEQYQEDLRLIKKFDAPNQLRLLQSNVEQAKAELDRLKQRTSNEIAQAEADLKTSQTALDFMEEGIDTLRQRLLNAKILAPQNGLVVYAQVSPFQTGNNDLQRSGEGRFSRGRGGGFGGGDSGSGLFGGSRGGNRRGGGGGGLSSESSSRSGSSGSSVSSAAETVASGNQRIASAVSGNAATVSSAAGGGTGSSGDRSSGGGGGGESVSSAASAFASYPSMRPSSRLGAAGSTNTPSSSSSGNSSSSSASSSTSDSRSGSFGNSSQFGFRSRSQSYSDFGEQYGTPGLLEEGMMVRQRQELIRLPDVSKMLAEIKIEEGRVGQLRPGMTAYVQVKTIPNQRFKGTVRRVAPMPDAQDSWMNPNKKVFPTDVLIDDELPILKPGVSVTTEIVVTNLAKVLSVPIQTVARWKGEHVCFVKKGSRVTPIPVTTGWFNDAFVEITSGLSEGDLVLLAAVSDEPEEESENGETSDVPATATPPRPQPAEEPVNGGRGIGRRNGNAVDGEAGPDRPRNRQRDQRSQNPPNGAP